MLQSAALQSDPWYLSRTSDLVPPAEEVTNSLPLRSYREIRETFQREMWSYYAPPSTHPFHNALHHLEPGIAYMRALFEQCKKENIALDEDVVDAAWIGHDAGFALSPAHLGFKSREHLSATLAYRCLRSLGADEEFARRVERTIAKTHFLEIPETQEEKAVRAIDLHNIGGNYGVMRENTLLLFEELRNSTSAKLSFTEFVHGSVKFLAQYMLPVIRLTSRASDEEGRSMWHMQSFDNLLRLYREHNYEGRIPRVTARLGKMLPVEQALSQQGLKRGDLFVDTGPDDDLWVRYGSATKVTKSWEAQAPVLCVPGTKYVSLPPASVDCELIDSRDVETMLPEIKRTLKQGGDLIVTVDFNACTLVDAMDEIVEGVLSAEGFIKAMEESTTFGEKIWFTYTGN